jgi:hypothetical protein
MGGRSIRAASVQVDQPGPARNLRGATDFSHNHGGFSATIVAGAQHLANIWAKTGLAIACAAF